MNKQFYSGMQLKNNKKCWRLVEKSNIIRYIKFDEKDINGKWNSENFSSMSSYIHLEKPRTTWLNNEFLFWITFESWFDACSSSGTGTNQLFTEPCNAIIGLTLMAR